jgi:hypothetical protein
MKSLWICLILLLNNGCCKDPIANPDFRLPYIGNYTFFFHHQYIIKSSQLTLVVNQDTAVIGNVSIGKDSLELLVNWGTNKLSYDWYTSDSSSHIYFSNSTLTFDKDHLNFYINMENPVSYEPRFLSKDSMQYMLSDATHSLVIKGVKRK